MELMALQNQVLREIHGRAQSELIAMVPYIDGTYIKAYMAKLVGKDETFIYKRNFLQYRKVFNRDQARVEYAWTLDDDPAVYEIRIRYFGSGNGMEQAEDRQVVFCGGAAEDFDCYLLKSQEQIDAALADPIGFSDENNGSYDNFIG